MSLDNDETAVEETDIEQDLEQADLGVASEQSESEENQGVAAEGDETEQTGETEDNFNLGDVLSGEAEPDEKESKVPRSTRRALRKSKRLEKELAASQQQVEQLTNSQAPKVEAQVPVRDWDNETDEQYNFRAMQAALGHQQNVNSAGQQHNQQVQQATDDLKVQREVIDKYSEEVDKLNLKGYDDAESRVLDSMPEGSLAYMSKMNPAMTAKIIYHLDHNPEKLAMFSDLAHNNANGFNYQFGKLETAINELENRARRKHKQVSKATGDRALDNSGSSGNSLAGRMQAAADKGDYAGYRKLKAQLKK